LVGSGQTKAFLRSTSGQMSKPIITWKTPNHDRTRCHYFHLSKTKTDSNILDSYCFDLFYNILYTSYIFLHLHTSLPPSLMLHEISTGVHLSERQGAPVLICPVRRPTTKSAMKESWHDQLISFLQNPKKKNTTKSHSYHSYFVQFNAFFVQFC